MKKSNLLKNGIKSAVAIFFVLAFVFALTVCASAESVERSIAGRSTVWKYLDDGTDPSDGLSDVAAWAAPDFDDSAWKSARGSFGSLDGEIAEIANITPDNLLNLYKAGTKECISTAFFRTKVKIDDVSPYKTLAFKINANDAIVVYINGTPVADTRKQKNNKNNLHYTASNTSSEAFLVELSQYPSLFKNGDNVIAVQVHNSGKSSEDILFDVEKMVLIGNSDPIVAEQLILNIGKTETERNLSWFSNIKSSGEVRLALASDVKNGVFPAEYKTFSAKSKVASNAVGKYAKSATITGLEENTKYAYTIAADGKTSKIFYFETKSFSDFTIAYFGDPQLYSSAHGASWKDSVVKATNAFSPSFMISAGDQVNAPENEGYYSYFVIDELASASLAATVGPGHDSPSATFSDHFNLPNLSDKYAANDTSANYWYTYGNTLFMHLNMSDTQAAANGEHERFLKETIAQNQDAMWRIVVMHISIFSASEHATGDIIGNYRKELAPVFTELDIDVVLSAHEHVYVRSKMMVNTEVCDDVVENNKVHDPVGILYLCASSSTNSKYYSKAGDFDYVAFENYEERKGAIKIDVTGDSLTFTSYHLDDMSVFDTFTIEKTPHVCVLKKVDEIPVTCVERGQLAYYVCECGRAYEDAEGKVGIINVFDWATLYPDGHDYAGDCDPECDSCGEAREAEPHSDANGDGVCDGCRLSLNGDDKDKDTSSDNTVIIICAVGACVVAVGVIAFVLLRKKSKGKKA